MFTLTAYDGRSVCLGGMFDVWRMLADNSAAALDSHPALRVLGGLDGIDLGVEQLKQLGDEARAAKAARGLSTDVIKILDQVILLADGGGDPPDAEALNTEVPATTQFAGLEQVQRVAETTHGLNRLGRPPLVEAA